MYMKNNNNNGHTNRNTNIIDVQFNWVCYDSGDELSVVDIFEYKSKVIEQKPLYYDWSK